MEGTSYPLADMGMELTLTIGADGAADSFLPLCFLPFFVLPERAACTLQKVRSILHCAPVAFPYDNSF